MQHVHRIIAVHPVPMDIICRKTTLVRSVNLNALHVLHTLTVPSVQMAITFLVQTALPVPSDAVIIVTSLLASVPAHQATLGRCVMDVERVSMDPRVNLAVQHRV